MNDLPVGADRFARWVANFGTRHGEPTLSVADGGLRGAAADGSWFQARLPFDRAYDARPGVSDFVAEVVCPANWGVLLVRKGGFAIARLEGDRPIESKVGQRHVQGRTKAGGQSQQRFARRRDNQAREAYRAAADHAARVLTGVTAVVTGGDRAAVAAVLADPRLSRVVRTGPWLDVPDPRRAVLDRAILDAGAIWVSVHNAAPGTGPGLPG